jgi:hypothetical protein
MQDYKGKMVSGGKWWQEAFLGRPLFPAPPITEYHRFFLENKMVPDTISPNNLDPHNSDVL